MANYSVFGMGNPLMDLIGRVPAERLARIGAAPGTMSLVDAGRAAQVAGGLRRHERRPGGSCANTLRGLAWLDRLAAGGASAPPVMTGMVGGDALGRELTRRLAAAGVASRLGAHPREPTGTSVVLVTPDGQRTMFTSLGACRTLTAGHVDRPALAASACFYATAYLWGPDRPEAALRAAAAQARAGGVPVAFDVADVLVVREFGRELLDWIAGSVDLLFANEQEARALAELVAGRRAGQLAGGDPVSACAPLAGVTPAVVVKLGAAGCLVLERGAAPALVAGAPVDPLDTTGAGDSFAAGYLHAMLAGGSAAQAAALGNRVAAAIVAVDGCDYESIDSSAVSAGPVSADGPVSPLAASVSPLADTPPSPRATSV